MSKQFWLKIAILRRVNSANTRVPQKTNEYDAASETPNIRVRALRHAMGSQGRIGLRTEGHCGRCLFSHWRKGGIVMGDFSSPLRCARNDSSARAAVL